MNNLMNSTIYPCDKFRAVTPSDANPLTEGICSSVYVGGAGNLSFVDVTGTTVTATGLLAGMVYPFRTSKILSTGTTATNVLAMYNLT